MCLDVDDDFGGVMLGSGERKARKEHRCQECGRTIEPGERYRYWCHVGGEFSEGKQTDKMCAHCWGTIDLGARLTGCPRYWFWDKVHDLDPDDGGFVGDILVNHDLAFADRFRMLRTVVARKSQWRRKDGSLFPIPALAGGTEGDPR